MDNNNPELNQGQTLPLTKKERIRALLATEDRLLARLNEVKTIRKGGMYDSATQASISRQVNRDLSEVRAELRELEGES